VRVSLEGVAGTGEALTRGDALTCDWAGAGEARAGEVEELLREARLLVFAAVRLLVRETVGVVKARWLSVTSAGIDCEFWEMFGIAGSTAADEGEDVDFVEFLLNFGEELIISRGESELRLSAEPELFLARFDTGVASNVSLAFLFCDRVDEPSVSSGGLVLLEVLEVFFLDEAACVGFRDATGRLASHIWHLRFALSLKNVHAAHVHLPSGTGISSVDMIVGLAVCSTLKEGNNDA